MLTMQPRLQAEESLLETTRVGLGTGSLGEQDAGAIQRAWALAAQIEASKPKVDPVALQAAGIAIRRIPKKKAPPSE